MGFCFSKHKESEKKDNTLLSLRQSLDIFGTPEYVKYSQKSHCEEIPEFLYWCQEFKNNFTGTLEDDIKAWFIYNTFISEQGESQVNLSDEVRKEVEKGLVEGDLLKRTIFDESFNEIKKLGVVNFHRL